MGVKSAETRLLQAAAAWQLSGAQDAQRLELLKAAEQYGLEKRRMRNRRDDYKARTRLRE
jgi:hypothetical protein